MIRLSKIHEYIIYLISVIVIISGFLWLYFDFFVRVETEFSLQFTWKKLFFSKINVIIIKIFSYFAWHFIAVFFNIAWHCVAFSCI